MPVHYDTVKGVSDRIECLFKDVSFEKCALYYKNRKQQFFFCIPKDWQLHLGYDPILLVNLPCADGNLTQVTHVPTKAQSCL